MKGRLLLVLGFALLVPQGLAAQTPVVEYYAVDAVGSVRVVFDENGNVKGRTDYTPFGVQLDPDVALPVERFAGLVRDSEAGLDHARARSYQARTGRFSTTDPVYVGVAEPQRWNRYAYARNRPTTLVDPSGLFDEPVFTGLGPLYDVSVSAKLPGNTNPIGGMLNNSGIDGGMLIDLGDQDLAGTGGNTGTTNQTPNPGSNPGPGQDPDVDPNNGPNREPGCDPNLPSDMGGCLPISPQTARRTVQCISDHYGLTLLAGASVAGAVPIPKTGLEMPVLPGTSQHTNPLSLLGHTEPGRTMGRMPVRVGQTMNLFRLAGRINTVVAPVLSVLDIAVIHGCVARQ